MLAVARPLMTTALEAAPPPTTALKEPREPTRLHCLKTCLTDQSQDLLDARPRFLGVVGFMV